MLKDKNESSELENIVSAFLVTKKNPLLTKIKVKNESGNEAGLSRQRPSSLSVKHPNNMALVTGNKKTKLKRLMTMRRGSTGEKNTHWGDLPPLGGCVTQL